MTRQKNKHLRSLGKGNPGFPSIVQRLVAQLDNIDYLNHVIVQGILAQLTNYGFFEIVKFNLKSQNATSKYRMEFFEVPIWNLKTKNTLRSQFVTLKKDTVSLRSQIATLKDKRLLKNKKSGNYIKNETR